MLYEKLADLVERPFAGNTIYRSAPWKTGKRGGESRHSISWNGSKGSLILIVKKIIKSADPKKNPDSQSWGFTLEGQYDTIQALEGAGTLNLYHINSHISCDISCDILSHGAVKSYKMPKDITRCRKPETQYRRGLQVKTPSCKERGDNCRQRDLNIHARALNSL